VFKKIKIFKCYPEFATLDQAQRACNNYKIKILVVGAFYGTKLGSLIFQPLTGSPKNEISAGPVCFSWLQSAQERPAPINQAIINKFVFITYIK
jgi:hypothetical protein